MTNDLQSLDDRVGLNGGMHLVQLRLPCGNCGGDAVAELGASDLSAPDPIALFCTTCHSEMLVSGAGFDRADTFPRRDSEADYVCR